MHPQFDLSRYLGNLLSKPHATIQSKLMSQDGLTELMIALLGVERHLANLSDPKGIVCREIMGRILAELIDLRRAVPVDYVVWRKKPHDVPWLTRIGGIPWREKSLPWPHSTEKGDYTFVGQFYLKDSPEFFPFDLKGDLALVFFSMNGAMYGEECDVILEWSNKNLEAPCTDDDCPAGKFAVPQLYAELFRGFEYPDFEDYDAFFKCLPRLLQDAVSAWAPLTEFTRTGTEASWLQGNYDYETETLLCTLGCFNPHSEWPFPDQKESLGKPGDDQWFDGDRITASGTPMMYIHTSDGESLSQITESS